MKCISLWQPWASLIALGSKRIETRGWSTKLRGEIAIHAALRRPLIELNSLLALDVFQQGLSDLSPHRITVDDLPFGAILATCKITDVRHTEELRNRISPHEFEYGDYRDNRFGWMLEDIRRLKEPIPIKGRQGLFNVDLEACELQEWAFIENIEKK